MCTLYYLCCSDSLKTGNVLNIINTVKSNLKTQETQYLTMHCVVCSEQQLIDATEDTS